MWLTYEKFVSLPVIVDWKFRILISFGLSGMGIDALRPTVIAHTIGKILWN